jgi:hypothetical protein
LFGPRNPVAESPVPPARRDDGPRRLGQAGGQAKITSGWPPGFAPLTRHSLIPGCLMSASSGQALVSPHLAARMTARRRPVPPLPRTLMPRSVHQRWRERPRCSASPLAPGRRDGVVHAIVGCVACRCLRVPFLQNERAARVSVFVPRRGRTMWPMNRTEGRSRAWQLIPENTAREHVWIWSTHHRACDAGAVLGIVNALRFASTRPAAGPAGIDDASARHSFGNCAMVVSVMAARTRLTRASRGRMLKSIRRCRAALPPFASTAYGARIRPTPSGHGFQRTSHHIAARCTTTESGWSARL